MQYKIVVTEREIDTIEKRLVDLGDEIVRLKPPVESSQAKMRRAMLGLEDNGGRGALIGSLSFGASAKTEAKPFGACRDLPALVKWGVAA